jgi:hypothetical protein
MNTDDFKNEEEFDLYVKGAWDERERVLALWEAEMRCRCIRAMDHLASRIKEGK